MTYGLTVALIVSEHYHSSHHGMKNILKKDC